MKAVLVILAVVFGLTLIAPVIAQAADYSKMSNDQLYQMRKQGVSPQESSNLEAEWINRVLAMSPEERQKYQVRYSDKEIQQMRIQHDAPTR